MRTEINGFQWYCYRNIEAYSIDGRRLFTDMIVDDKVYKIKKIFNISFLTADKSDKGIFVIDCESKVFNKIVCDCNGKLILGIGNRSDEFHRIKEVFSNKDTKYFIRQYRRPKEYWLFNDDGKCLFYSYESYSIAGDLFLVKEHGDELYRIVKSDGKVLVDYLHSLEYMKASNHILVSYNMNYSRFYAILDVRTEKTIIKNAKNIKYEDDVIKIEKDGSKGLMSYKGKWIVTPEKGYTDCVLLKRKEKLYRIKYRKSSKYHLVSSDGVDIFNSGYDVIDNIANSDCVRIKDNGSYGIRTIDGKEIIPTSRGYNFISYNRDKGTFAFTKKGYSGMCDKQGREISTTRLAPTPDDIKTDGGYASAVEMRNGNTKYYKVSKGGRYGLTNTDGREIVPCEMEALESDGSGYLKYKLNGFWGVMNYFR